MQRQGHTLPSLKGHADMGKSPTTGERPMLHPSSKSPRGQSKELQNGQIYASLLENSAVSPLYKPGRNTILGTCRMPSVIKLLGLQTRGEQFMSLTSN